MSNWRYNVRYKNITTPSKYLNLKFGMKNAKKNRVVSLVSNILK